MDIALLTPKVSIITVCLNEKERILRTIDSVIGQTCKNFEWIVVDGQSTDGTFEILKRYENQINILISEKDKGIYNAMNKGIARATGEYCLFLNGGDRLYDNQAVLKFCQAKITDDIVYGGIIEIKDKKNESCKFLSPIQNYKDYLYRCCLPHQSTFIKRNLFHRYGFYNEKYIVNADLDFFVKTIVKNKVSVAHIPSIISVFYFDGLSYHTKGSLKNDLEWKSIRNEYFSTMFKVRYNINYIISKIIGRNT